MALSSKDTTGRGNSDSLQSSEDGSAPGNAELAKLSDAVKSLKDEYTRASITLSEMESVYTTCSGRLADWYALVGRINGVLDSLSEPSSSAKEEQMKARELRLWSLIARGVLSLGLSKTLFGGDDEQLAEKLATLFRVRVTVSDGDGDKAKQDGPFEVPRGSR